MVECHFCSKPVRRSRAVVLIDPKGEICGIYGSRYCADLDACGPRFRPREKCNIWKATPQEWDTYKREEGL
jgi:hypothetical protein